MLHQIPNLNVVTACSCLCGIYWSQVLSGEWRCSLSNAAYIRYLTQMEWASNILKSIVRENDATKSKMITSISTSLWTDMLNIRYNCFRHILCFQISYLVLNEEYRHTVWKTRPASRNSTSTHISMKSAMMATFWSRCDLLPAITASHFENGIWKLWKNDSSNSSLASYSFQLLFLCVLLCYCVLKISKDLIWLGKRRRVDINDKD